MSARIFLNLKLKIQEIGLMIDKWIPFFCNFFYFQPPRPKGYLAKINTCKKVVIN